MEVGEVGGGVCVEVCPDETTSIYEGYVTDQNRMTNGRAERTPERGATASGATKVARVSEDSIDERVRVMGASGTAKSVVMCRER